MEVANHAWSGITLAQENGIVKQHHVLTQVRHQETDRARNGSVGLVFD